MTGLSPAHDSSTNSQAGLVHRTWGQPCSQALPVSGKFLMYNVIRQLPKIEAGASGDAVARTRTSTVTCWRLTRCHELTAERPDGLRWPMPTERHGPWRAAKTCSVSYNSVEIDPATLGRVPASGELPSAYVAHVAHLLDESLMLVGVAAIGEAAARGHVPLNQVWRNVATLVEALGISRRGFGDTTES